jgi:indole-3-glycerol phosphate synthase
LSAYTNTGTVLDRILEARRAEVEHRKCVLPETALKYGAKAALPLRDFTAALTRDGLNVIAELKPASPSRGVIREPFDAIELAKSLSGAGAAALSVLTEGEYFHGSLKNLRDARKAIDVPVLRKDFIFDPWQVWEARANDADSFLLIVAALEDSLLRDLISLGREIGMEPVVEVHSASEVERAIAASARIIGVNNRDLKTMAVRTETSFELIELIPEEFLAVSESGIGTHGELVNLRRVGFDAFLIGEHLMLAKDPAAALRDLLRYTGGNQSEPGGLDIEPGPGEKIPEIGTQMGNVDL